MVERTVIVCDDHPLFRSGVVSCLSEMAGVVVVAQATDAASAKAKLQLYTPDILVTDLSMPGENGFDLLIWAKQEMPELVVIVLSMHTELAFVQQARELGAAGFLAKEDAETELIGVITQNNNGFFTSQSIGSSMPPDPPALLASPRETELLKYISSAEMKVLQLLAHSMTSKSIADQLNISPRTVEAHRRKISEKLDLKGPNRLIEFAIKNRKILSKND